MNPTPAKFIDRVRAYSSGEEFTRDMTAAVTTREDGGLEMSFSSEAEIELWPGTFERLSHSPGCCDLSRLNNSACLLFNHNRSFQLGRLDTVSIDNDKKGRCVIPKEARSQTAAAQEIWKDIDSGVLRNSSVGYRPIAYTEEKRADGSTLYNVTEWQPSEVSIVTVPADLTTGANRADNTNNADEMNKHNRYQRRFLEPDTGANATTGAAKTGTEAQATIVTIEQERTAGATSERERVSTIMETCRTYNAPEIAERAIREGLSLDALRGLLLAEVNKRNVTLAETGKPIGMSGQEVGKFRFLSLFRALADPTNPRVQEAAKLELEACQAAGDQIKHRSLKGIMIPSDVLLAPLGIQREGQRANAISVQGGAGYTGDGANVIANTLLASAFIDILRHKCVLMQLGTQLGGLVGNFEIPKMTSSQYGGGWIGEDAVAPNTQVDFGQIPLSVKTAAAYVYITRKMLTQPSIGVEALCRMDIAKKLAQTLDLAGYYGTGTASDPVGLKNTNGINGQPFAGAQPTFAELVNMETRIALDDADVDSMAYVANAAFRGYAKTTLKFPLIQGAGGVITQVSNGGTIWEPGDTVNGYRCPITNQVATGDVFFGNWADMLIGLWGGLEIIADPYTKSQQGGVIISAFQDMDIAIRRVQSFCFGSQTEAANQA